jgi:hypothetical protein
MNSRRTYFAYFAYFALSKTPARRLQGSDREQGGRRTLAPG